MRYALGRSRCRNIAGFCGGGIRILPGRRRVAASKAGVEGVIVTGIVFFKLRIIL